MMKLKSALMTKKGSLKLPFSTSYNVYYVNFRNTYKNSKAEKIYLSMIQKKYVKSNMMAEGVGSLVSS